MKVEKNMFKLGMYKQLNPTYKINIAELRIETPCCYWYFDTLEDLIEAIKELTREIEEGK